MIHQDEFTAVLAGLQEVLPMGKTLSEAGLRMAWALFPTAAKDQLVMEQLLYAVQQRIVDPAPAAEQAVTQQLLRYLYPCRDGQPDLEQGLRSDLVQRMANPERFHPLTTTAEARPAAEVITTAGLALPEGVVQQIERVTKPLLLAAMAVTEAGGHEPSPYTAKQLQCGAQLAAGSLIGRWPLQSLKRRDGRPDLAHEWIRTHPNGWAAMQQLAQEALEPHCGMPPTPDEVEAPSWAA